MFARAMFARAPCLSSGLLFTCVCSDLPELEICRFSPFGLKYADFLAYADFLRLARKYAAALLPFFWGVARKCSERLALSLVGRPNSGLRSLRRRRRRRRQRLRALARAPRLSSTTKLVRRAARPLSKLPQKPRLDRNYRPLEAVRRSVRSMCSMF